jgi:hypothetical protein
MTNTYRRFADSDEGRAQMEQISRAAGATSELARRYLAVRHQCERTRAEARDLRAASAALRQQLREALGCYVGLLHGEGTPRDLAVWLVKDMIDPAQPAVDASHADLLDELERWSHDVYDAA